jgi:16S rRNA (guanine1207-N2)-methyltransferase
MQNPAESLLLEYLQPAAEAHILILEGGDGWLAVEAAQQFPESEVLSLARDIREVWAAETRLKAQPNASAARDVFPINAGWDIVLLPIPKGRRYTRKLLLAAWEALKPGGQLMLAGPSKGGAKAVIKDAERLFGNATVLGYRHHQRVAACTRGKALIGPLPKEFQQNGIAPGTRHFVKIQRPEGILTLETHPGIFSWETLDEGTALLLEHLEIEPGSRVWDVGCGYGAIGLSAALAGAEFVAMSDVNLIGVGYAQANALHNRLDHKVEAFPADALTTSHFTPSPAYFDLVVSNPAFHQGREVDKSMAGDLTVKALDFLAPGGRLVIVANRFLNYDKNMRESFGQVERVAETGKFHVIEARK